MPAASTTSTAQTADNTASPAAADSKTTNATMTSYAATLDGASEVPPNNSKGTGSVKAKFDPSSKQLTWTIAYSGLTGPATAAHFHGPADAGMNAPPVVPIKSDLASPIEGSTTLTDAQVAELQNGRMYFNIHTAANKDGELRGQLTK
ncbi:CHRD domain-containing protein [Bradyrhizobium sp. 83012]|uniref:CHRD domain-containing protein n=1 Tax=Bradyrhizobium aeschynomenes TaxID=2734909 RepID=A0ABX2C7J8_9BRAD|nr:CHRD domain-containing protein [Bradyrhizobium aeschynomenes]NPU63625.1 CHRD domain-containing protein [Bradyrhizobium aeschynomenes]NPV19374.1 CHRD domain-containing protein [Bradyrhizobium aeschynomenes]